MCHINNAKLDIDREVYVITAYQYLNSSDCVNNARNIYGIMKKLRNKHDTTANTNKQHIEKKKYFQYFEAFVSKKEKARKVNKIIKEHK